MRFSTTEEEAKKKEKKYEVGNEAQQFKVRF